MLNVLKKLKRSFFCSVIALLLLLQGSGTSSAETKLAAPERGIYHCAHPDFGVRDDCVTSEKIRAFTDIAGKNLVWAYLSFHWDRGIVFPAASCRTLHSEGIVPLVGLMPWSRLEQNKPEKKYTLEKIIAGDFDRELAKCAADVRSLGFPIMIEFGPEADGPWFPWSGAWNGRDGDKYGVRGWPDGPERFRDAYRHVVNIFRANGALDVTWVFHAASAEPKKGLEWNDIKYYYPGDDYVDWIGVSVYGRLRESAPLKTFESIMQRVYPTLAALSPIKPIAVLEFGVSEGTEPKEKASWIKSAFASVISGRYPRVKAVSWWNKIYRPDGSRSSLEIESSRESLEAYRDGIQPLLDTPLWVGCRQ